MTNGFFFQDDWKVNNKLTLNLGLRWEFESPLKERFNRSVSNFDPNYVQPFGAAAEAAYAAVPAMAGTSIRVKGGLMFTNGEALYNTPKLNLMPRIGFAYQVASNTVVRGGFGMFNGFLGERRGDVIQSGYTRQTPFNAFAADGTTIIARLQDPFPNGILEPLGKSQGGQTYVGQNISFFNMGPQDSHQLPLAVERAAGTRQGRPVRGRLRGQQGRPAGTHPQYQCAAAEVFEHQSVPRQRYQRAAHRIGAESVLRSEPAHRHAHHVHGQDHQRAATAAAVSAVPGHQHQQQ